MKRRIIILGNVLVVLTVIFICLFGYRKFKADYITQTETYLRTIADFYKENIDQNPSTHDYQELNEQTIRTFENLNVIDLRMTILNMEGQVLQDSDFSLDQLNNHRSREEVYAIIKGAEEAKAVRFSDTEKKEVLYYASRDDVNQLIVRISSSLDFLLSARNTFIKYGLIGALISLFLFNLTLYFLFRKQDETLHSFADSLEKIEKGNLSERLWEDRYTNKELYRLAQQFNPALENIENQYDEMKTGRFWLQSIVNALDEPLIVVNQDINVVFANSYAMKLFNRHINPETHSYPFVLLTHEEKIDALCQEVFEKKRTIRKEFVLQVEMGTNPFQVIISPVDEKHCIVLFHDMTEEYDIRSMRTDFVANVTHELKTPLTSIRGFIETLRQMDQNREPEQVNRFLDIIDVEADRLTRLINDILRLSDIEHLQEDQHFENFDLVELLDECCVQLDDFASQRHVDLIPDEDPVFLPVYANRDRIKQIFINLIDNAIKYNREHGKVWISLKRENEFVEIKVKDNGEGFSEQEAKRVFERFYRVDKSRSRSLGGTGLGLSIVKHIALLYQGEATVESELNEGSTFIVRLKI